MSFHKVSYVTAACDNCGPDWWDDGDAEGTPLFTSQAAARRSLAADYEWRIVQQINGRFRMICGTCASEEDCEQFGHQWRAAELDPAGGSPPRAAPIELCRRCGKVRREDIPPLNHPESMTALLGDEQENWLALVDETLFPEEAA